MTDSVTNKETVNNNTGSSRSGHSRLTRVFYLVVFLVVFRVLQTVLAVLAIVIFICEELVGRSMSQLSSFGASLGAYARNIVRFQTYNDAEPPWPFSDWPDE